MGTVGLSGLERLLVSSTTERVLRKAPCAEWTHSDTHQLQLRLRDAASSGMMKACLRCQSTMQDQRAGPVTTCAQEWGWVNFTKDGIGLTC